MSLLISDFREKKDEVQKEEKETKRDTLLDIEIKKYMKKLPSDNQAGMRLSYDKRADNDNKWNIKGLMSIPEVNDEPFLTKVCKESSFSNMLKQ